MLARTFKADSLGDDENEVQPQARDVGECECSHLTDSDSEAVEDVQQPQLKNKRSASRMD